MINIAVVGFGRHFERSLLPNMVGTGGMTIAAIADPDAERRDVARALLPGVRTHDTYRDLLEAPDIDAFVVAAHPGVHAAITQEALIAGKHVFVEKPISAEASSVRPLLDASVDLERVVMTGTMWRHTAANRILRTWMEREGVRPTMLTVSATFPGVTVRDGWNVGSLRNAFLDMFIHPIDWTLSMMGPVVRVDAALCSATGAAPAVSLRLTNREGAMACLNLVTGSKAYQVASWISLSDGSLVEMQDNDRLAITTTPTWSGTEGWIRDRPRLTWESGQLYRGWSRHGYREEFDEFLGRISEDRDHAKGLVEAVAALEVVDASVKALVT